MTNQEIYSKVTAIISDELKKGVAPWKTPYKINTPSLGRHHGINSKSAYNGINAFVTFIVAFKRGFTSARWASFNQWRESGRFVRKGEKGSPILFFKMFERANDKGEIEEIPLARYFNVFNESQLEATEGLTTALPDSLPQKKAEEIFAHSPLCNIQIISGRPAYSVTRDTVMMPKAEEFHSMDSYYSTLFHECAHATGHESRLNRETLKAVSKFADHAYSKEELIAELTSAFLQGVCGINGELEQSASYCESWLKSLENDPKIFVSAASQAQKAADYILGVKKVSTESETSH